MTTHISRVKSAIKHQTGVSIPKGEFTIDLAFAHDFIRWKGRVLDLDELSETDLLIECSRHLGHDLICLQSGNTADPQSSSLKNLKAIKSVSRDGFFVFWVVNGAFQLATDQCGLMDLLMDISHSPNKVGDKLRWLSDQVMAAMVQGVDSGAHGIILADDIAYQQSTYMSPTFIEHYLLPLWKAQVTTAIGLDVPVFFHSDGNINAVLPFIVEAGFDGLQCIEPTANMDILSIKKAYGHQLCLMGNVSPALLSYKIRQAHNPTTDEQLAQVVDTLMDSASTDGGLIFGTCSGLHRGMSPERVDLMCRLVSDRQHFS